MVVDARRSKGCGGLVDVGVDGLRVFELMMKTLCRWCDGVMVFCWLREKRRR